MKKVLLFALAFFTFASSGLFAHFYNRTDDGSLRYVLWKKGLHPYPSEIISSAVIADRERDELIRGKSKREVRKLFPDAAERLGDYEKIYANELRGREYLWLGKHGVIVFFVDGKGHEISILKG